MMHIGCLLLAVRHRPCRILRNGQVVHTGCIDFLQEPGCILPSALVRQPSFLGMRRTVAWLHSMFAPLVASVVVAVVAFAPSVVVVAFVASVVGTFVVVELASVAVAAVVLGRVGSFLASCLSFEKTGLTRYSEQSLFLAGQSQTLHRHRLLLAHFHPWILLSS